MHRFRPLVAAIFIFLAEAPAHAMISTEMGDTSIANAMHAKVDSPVNTGREGKMNTLAVVGFILSILAPPVGIVLSFIALHQARKHHQRGRDLAKAGVIVGFSMIGAFIIFSFFYIVTHGEHG